LLTVSAPVASPRARSARLLAVAGTGETLRNSSDSAGNVYARRLAADLCGPEGTIRGSKRIPRSTVPRDTDYPVAAVSSAPAAVLAAQERPAAR
jgi:hypothetical protein